MHAIDTAGAVDGQFQEGNPAVGQRATKVGADWLNDVQANLLAVLTEGGIDPEKGRAADLVDAIIAIANGVTGDGGGAVPTTRTISGGGLVTGGGALSANRTLTVNKASGAEIINASEDGKAVTPAGMRAAMGPTFVADKSVNLFGFIVKWGERHEGFAEGGVYTAFGDPFPTGCLMVIPVGWNGSSDNARDQWIQNVSKTADGFTVFVQRIGGTLDTPGFDWIAIGV